MCILYLKLKQSTLKFNLLLHNFNYASLNFNLRYLHAYVNIYMLRWSLLIHNNDTNYIKLRWTSLQWRWCQKATLGECNSALRDGVSCTRGRRWGSTKACVLPSHTQSGVIEVRGEGGCGENIIGSGVGQTEDKKGEGKNEQIC